MEPDYPRHFRLGPNVYQADAAIVNFASVRLCAGMHHGVTLYCGLFIDEDGAHDSWRILCDCGSPDCSGGTKDDDLAGGEDGLLFLDKKGAEEFLFRAGFAEGQDDQEIDAYLERKRRKT